ncbi:type I phosphomannose isomerase catalytic subunit [Orenia marismortui]|uniref:type I phosphomannose isomerase catalytic subunit n=1 Tax=Orenia marismortui TaxID=46469 RepID=UPI00035EAFC5
MYPLKFEAIYKKKIWGGRSLEDKFSRVLPKGLIGESWELAAHKNGVSKISNGKLAGKTLMEVIAEKGEKILGSEAKDDYYKKFPLLIKILDANDKLSVQVHPDDYYANEYEDGELGKTEMWYVIDAKKDAKLIYGVKPEISKEEFATLIKEGRLEDALIEISVKTGDILYIPTGTVHAIEEGVLIAEIQQNSDTTYRVYDWNRLGQDGTPRKLHIESALDVIDFGVEPIAKVTGLEIKEEGYSKNILVASPYFITELLEIEECYVSNTDNERFYILMGLDGEATLYYDQGAMKIKEGETVLLPASLGSYKIKGQAKLIRSYIKDIVEFRDRLQEEGYSKEEIKKIKGL